MYHHFFVSVILLASASSASAAGDPSKDFDRVLGSDYRDLRLQAALAYEAKKYGEALEKFQRLACAGDKPSQATLGEMYRKTRQQGFGAEVKRRIMLGTYVLSAGYYDAYYLRAQKVRTLVAQDFADAFQEVDAIVTPTAPTPAFKLGERTSDPLRMYLADIFTVTGSLAGIPGISVPCGKSSIGLPIGMQIFGPHFSEGRVMQLAHAFEKAGGFSV